MSTGFHFGNNGPHVGQIIEHTVNGEIVRERIIAIDRAIVGDFLKLTTEPVSVAGYTAIGLDRTINVKEPKP